MGFMCFKCWNLSLSFEAQILIQRKVKFVFSKKATKNDEIFTVNLTVCSKCQIYGEDFVSFCGLL